ncbi:hypothetical protein [Elioraea tepidiphila]|jgi:hypothetical protein|uniref:hypothetical protein n=1 Tax=Elioraea tepidiphila TaxID=457934 RepID=UPI002FD89A49
MRMSIKDVPLPVRRLAAQHLESLRGTELMNGMEDARLADTVVPIHRPDIDGVAYYEFAVMGGRGGGTALRLATRGLAKGGDCGCGGKDTPTAPGAGAMAARGFVVVTNGRHDLPIPHWSLDQAPPSVAVMQRQEGFCPKEGEVGAEPARLYRLDALAYAAEDANGRLVGQLGQIPSLIVGLPHRLERYAGAISGAIAIPFGEQRTDEGAENARHEVKTSGPDAPQLATAEPDGWAEFKKRYADAFGPMLDHLRDRAARVWEIEEAVARFGEGILAGTTHRVALLDEAKLEITGEGARHVRASVEESPGGAPVLVLTASPLSLPQELDLQVAASYADGTKEMLRFFVVSRDVPSNTKADRSRDGLIECEE